MFAFVMGRVGKKQYWYVTAAYDTTSKADTRVPFSAWTLYGNFDIGWGKVRVCGFV